MKRLLALFLLLLPILACAQENILDNYKCSVTLPPGERWQRGYPQKLQVGEMIFNAIRPESQQIFAILVVPEIPSDDTTSPVVISRMMEAITGMGYRTGPPTQIEAEGVRYAEFIAKRGESSGTEVSAVIRATVRGRSLYLAMMVGKGDDASPSDAQFMRVLKTFRFLEDIAMLAPPTSNPLFMQYRQGAFICAGIIAGLLLAFGLTMLVTYRNAYR